MTTPPEKLESGKLSWMSLDDVEARVRALESLLVERGLAESSAVDAVVNAFENDMGPMNGAKVVARAWMEPDFKEWLLRDATAAIGSMGFTGLQSEHLLAVENTDDVHNVIVCTLCSCYPWTLLGGIPPAWFKYPPVPCAGRQGAARGSRGVRRAARSARADRRLGHQRRAALPGVAPSVLPVPTAGVPSSWLGSSAATRWWASRSWTSRRDRVDHRPPRPRRRRGDPTLQRRADL